LQTRKGKAGEQAARTAGSEAAVNGAKLAELFSRPRAPKHLLAGLRTLGFTADSVQTMTGAKSRDVVYSWAAGRARPGSTQAERLDEIRHLLHLICRRRELGADSAWMLFNARFAGMDPNGPTAMEMVGRGEAAQVMAGLEALLDDEHGGPPDETPPEPTPPDPAREAISRGS